MGTSDFMDRTLLKREILAAALSHVPFQGWKDIIIKEALEELGQDPSWGWRLFPEGVRDLVEFWSLTLDEEMLESLKDFPTETLKIREKIALAAKIRIQLLSSHKEAARLLSLYLAKPQHAPLAVRLLAKTMDEIWYWAGDQATDYNYYTKRMLLGGVFSSTLIYWFNDNSSESEKTWTFLNHRIEDAVTLPKWPQKMWGCLREKLGISF